MASFCRLPNMKNSKKLQQNAAKIDCMFIGAIHLGSSVALLDHLLFASVNIAIHNTTLPTSIAKSTASTANVLRSITLLFEAARI